MLTEAEGLADLGLWQDAWDALEAAPAEMRSQPAALRVRLRCCPGPGAWAIGEHLAGVLRDGTEADREAAARFYHALALFHARSGMEEGAKDAIKAAASAWPDIREAMLDDQALENSLLGRGWVKLLPMIERIVSGGQTGADIAALDIALRHDFPHGGWCPKGRKSGAGRRPDQYQLDETPAANYLQRTEWNVRDTDGTVNVICEMTEKCAMKVACGIVMAVMAATALADVPARSPIEQPYPCLAGEGFTSERVPESPDPLVAYRWSTPRATDGLEVFVTQVKDFDTNEPDSFTNLDSLTGESPLVEVKGTGSIRLDFGAVHAAWLEFDSPNCPGGVEMSISEYNEPAIVNRMPENPVKTLEPVRYGDTYRLELNRHLYEGVRFGWIHVREFTEPWQITGVRLVCQTKPVNYEGSFSCSDPVLNQVWYTGAYVVRLNLLKDYIGAILMDRGDRHSWTGDAHPTQAASLVAFGNHDFIRHNIERTSGKDSIISYQLYWVLSVLDYWRYTGDDALLEKFISNISARLDQAYEVFGTEPAHVFYGWDERLGAGFDVRKHPTAEVHRSYEMLSIQVWRAFADAMAALGRKELEEKYHRYAEEKTAALRKDPDWYRSFGIHALSGAVNAGCVEPSEKDAIRGIEFDDRIQRLSFSPFNQYFILQAMADLKLHDEAFVSIRDLWGGQIEYGGTTFFEVFRPSWVDALGQNDPVPNNQCGFTSLAHPWGAGVVHWLSEVVLGIQPVSAGFEEYAVVPQLGRSLTWVKGHVPTPQGKIQLYLDTVKGAAVLSAPEGTTGTLGIPKSDLQMDSITFNQARVWDGGFHRVEGVTNATEDTEFVYLHGISPGKHHISFVRSGEARTCTVPPKHYATSCFDLDTETGGNWGGRYGKDGHVLVRYSDDHQDVQSLPDFIRSVTYDKFRPVRWADATEDPRALAPDRENGFPRSAAAVHTGNGGPADMIRAWHTQPLTLDIQWKEPHPCRIALYFVDWDRLGRRLAVEMFDAETRKLLAPVQVVKDHADGAYLVYEYDRSVRFRIQQIRGPNAALSGIFFDPLPSSARPTLLNGPE